MRIEYFVDKHSVVRQIWGKSDTILFIFAGAAAEFSLNKAVDWLFFTGRLPADPIGRLFSTVSYARSIIFAEKNTAIHAIDQMAAIHSAVESKRGAPIPDWAYRDVLFMLIDYSIRAFELLEHPLNRAEKEEVFQVFYRVGCRMALKGLPGSLEAWECMREDHLHDNLRHSAFTDELFTRYRKKLGLVRYRLLLDVQGHLVPPRVLELLYFRRNPLLPPLLEIYKLSRTIKADSLLKALLLPSGYRDEIRVLDACG